MIIAINAEIGSGKDTFYEFFCKNFPVKTENKKFAGKLKEIIALLTGCDRQNLEDEEFKNTFLPDEWIKDDGSKYTYREVLQIFGTDLMRDGFHKQVHINALFADYKSINHWPQYGIESETGNRFAIGMNVEYPCWLITDLRFKNEFDAVKQRGGITIKVVRCMEPIEWINSKYFNQIKFKNIGFHLIQSDEGRKISKREMVQMIATNQDLFLEDPKDKNFLKLIHASETDLNDYYDERKFDYVILNDSTLEVLEERIINLIAQISAR
jgi:hypothetical protein